jgi:phosphate transport system substrate-binding protein
MATLYKCPNLGNCDKADKSESISIPTGAPTQCPDCGSNLIPAQITGPSNGKTTQLAVIAGILLLAGIIGWFFLSGKKTKNTTTSTQSPSAADTLLRFHGSNTIGGKLLPALAEAFLKQEGYANVHREAGGNDEESNIVGEKNGTKSRIEIVAHGTKTAFEGLKSGRCDIGMASRPIKDEEWQELKPVLGDLRSNACEHVLALDGIAIIVHPSNPIKSLTTSQLADIFSGAVTDWSQVGGSGGAINVFARDEKSGTWDFFNEAVLKKRGKNLTKNATRLEDSKKLSSTVAENANAIGFIGLNYIGSNKALALSDAGVEARKPSQLTIKTEDYILSRRLYLYIPEKTSNSTVSKFIEFAVGPAAQQVVATAGLVNLDPTPVDVDPHDARNQSTRWRELTNGATEIATRFRFRKGSDGLDTRANRDIGRIVGVLSQPQYKNKKVLLIGFADSSGTKAFNDKLSQGRTEIVKKELGAEGVVFSNVVGLGAEAFVAPNDTPENREKNRRVEVWVK